ncbi:meiotically up-regulated gene family-domain-containing protein [Cercophora samala]|uniref:Meiotically up-regulated gene family-domain-containing protein n=1 Tax=Cercophora samala TaxID=330535 RepID=A0AA40D9R9_9PEZI|nr:meiotically up-regulated gene family-domain-containing protein [Cercophora samala]
MYFSKIIQLSVVLAGLAYAAPQPNPLLETVMLSNGDTTVAVQVEAVTPVGGGPHTGGEIFARGDILARQDSINCKGSSACSNRQGFKDSCLTAKNKIEDTTYASGGAKSGTCSGNCGVFVQGKDCIASGAVLRSAYDAIRRNGCQACGSAHWNNGCYITINYITGC